MDAASGSYGTSGATAARDADAWRSSAARVRYCVISSANTLGSQPSGAAPEVCGFFRPSEKMRPAADFFLGAALSTGMRSVCTWVAAEPRSRRYSSSTPSSNGESSGEVKIKSGTRSPNAASPSPADVAGTSSTVSLARTSVASCSDRRGSLSMARMICCILNKLLLPTFAA